MLVGTLEPSQFPISGCCVRPLYVDGWQNGPLPPLLQKTSSRIRAHSETGKPSAAKEVECKRSFLASASCGKLFRLCCSLILVGLTGGSSMILAPHLLHELAQPPCQLLVLCHSSLKEQQQVITFSVLLNYNCGLTFSPASA